MNLGCVIQPHPKPKQAARSDTAIMIFSSNRMIALKGAALLVTCLACLTGHAATVTWNGSVSTAWENPLNWSNGTGPAVSDIAVIQSGTSVFSTGTSPNLNALRLLGGTLNLQGGTFNCANSTTTASYVEGTLNHTGTAANFNELEIGRTAATTGFYAMSGGSLRISRSLGGFSLYLGGNASAATVSAGTGTFEIRGGTFFTRSGVKLGDASRSGTGQFSVLGSSISQIGIGSSTGDTDGKWEQNAGSTLKVGIDSGGVSRIFIDDSPTATTGTSATFASGSLLDVGYHLTGSGGGTWTVMEVENGPIINNGLAFAPGVNTAIWSFSIDNSGPNGLLKVTAAGTPNAIALTVTNTKKQKMRYGLDYERLWFWYGPTANMDTVARWSMIDCDVDYIRVAMNCEYELTEGIYNLAAYTDRIIPMMTAMKAAKPDIKFFASPRPLDEASGYENARWQPYPYWITGDPGNGSSFNFKWQKCAEYLVRYVKLMKTYGFKIDFMDMTNEWNFITATHIRDIKAYMVANLDATDMPLLIAPSAWSYAQGATWLAGADTAAKKAAIDIAACHNTDETGTAQGFANAAALHLPGKEIWNSELHGWMGNAPHLEIPTTSYIFETIRAGFSGINSWLAIGTTNQQHCYILNNGTDVTRNVKFHIFRKLSTTSNYGHALDINQPTQLTSTAALIRGNLMTVWVLNNHLESVPIRITPTGRSLAESTVKRTRWHSTLDLEGLSEHVPATANTSVWSTVAGNSLYCYEILLNPIGQPHTKIEAENFSAQSGVTTEACTDTGGGQNLTQISHNDSLRFDHLAPGTGSTLRFRVARATGTAESRIEVRQGSISGPVLGSIAVPVTGGSQIWETLEATLAPSNRSASLFLKFVENGTSLGTPLFNLNWISVTLPPVPEALASEPASATQIQLTWTAAAGATGYKLQRSTSPDGPYTEIGSTLTSNSYSDTGLIAGTRYYYVVRALFDGGVESSDSTQVSSVPSSPLTATDRAMTAAATSGNGESGMKFTLSFPQSGLGKFYQATSSTDFTQWSDASPVHMGNGGVLLIEIPVVSSEKKCFYKVKVWRE
jgi:hypothetical protein